MKQILCAFLLGYITACLVVIGFCLRQDWRKGKGEP